MVRAELVIQCWQCGQQEKIVEILRDEVIDFNLNKLCSNCRSGWMIKKELTIKKMA